MNLDNFVVRPKRRMVEKYARPEVWTALSEESLAELAHEVAGLPSEQDPEDEGAKRFDLLILNVQLAVLRAEPAFRRLSDQVRAIAGLLELGANQIEFVNLIVNHLTEHGVMGASLLYESPFTDLTPRGPDGLFSPSQLDELLGILDQVRAAAVAA